MLEAAATAPTPMTAIATYPIWGAVTRVAPDATAYSVREFVWDVNVICQWTDPGDTERCISWVRDLWARIEPLTMGSAYINHIAGDDKPEKVRASYGGNYDRLTAIKAKYDPNNLFHLNPNIQPGS